MENICPACGYKLDFKPWNGISASDEICPSCGIQFGYDDASGKNILEREIIYQNWRKNWISKGMKWYSHSETPTKWNPHEQLKKVM
jgi:hypothetical protein